MIRPALYAPHWGRGERLYFCLLVALLAHVFVLSIAALWSARPPQISPVFEAHLQATENAPEQAKAGVVNRQAAGNEAALSQQKQGDTNAADAAAGQRGAGKARQNQQTAALGQEVLRQRQAPMQVYYSHGISLAAGRAQPQQAGAALLQQGDDGIEQQTLAPDKPRRLSLGPASKEALALQYVEGWRRWMRVNGNTLYPEEARRRGLRGDVLTRVRLNKDGGLADVTILRSSGQRLLDQAVLKTTREARWYLPFPPELAAQYDQLEFSWRWRYGAATSPEQTH